ncbi:hypothetical protein BBK14_21790 [Parafrankia soli]|uniref:Uncharacterized protein n=1 Tax=Parafrankia soli TaxID=2599596 RepID=A0A1S1PWI9_9ACTN|nr:hypothetical protein BBK14_21790 [Parafrankia soli]
MDGGAFGVGLGGPAGDEGGVGTGFEGEPVALKLGVAVGDGPPGLGAIGVETDVGVVVLGGGEGGDGGGELGWGEGTGEPAVKVGDDEFLADVDAAGMFNVVGQCVLVGVDAAVVGLAVVPAALHSPPADSAPHPAAQLVGVSGALGLARAAGVELLGREAGLDLGEGLVVDERLVDDGRRVDPDVRVVPPHPGLVAEGDILDVEEDLVFALAVPDLPAGVPGVGQDGAQRCFGPRDTGAMGVTNRVVG